MTVLWMAIFLALNGIGFYIAAYTDEGEELAEALGGVGAFLGSGAGGFVFALVLSYPANGCPELQCENVLGSATISQTSAVVGAALVGGLAGLLGLFYRAVAISRKMEREKAAEKRTTRRP